MITPPRVGLDQRDAIQIVDDLLVRRTGYLPEQQWLPSERGPDIALVQIFARYLQAIIQRLNQAPEKNKLAFLDLLGIQLIPAQAARAPIVFQLSPQAADSRAPAGTRLAAPPPPDSAQQVVFETERSTELAAARLQQVVSFWPGRDQYIDHSAAFVAGKSFQLFKKRLLQDTPHVLYLAHDSLLALAGESRLDVEFELTTPGSEPLDLIWEYWDGKLWRGFKAMHPTCLEANEEKLDGTGGLTRSGRFRLETDCAETAKTTVNGVDAFWIRGRLDEPLPPDPARVLPEVETIKISSEIARPLTLSWLPQSEAVPGETAEYDVRVKVEDEAGLPLEGILVELLSPPTTILSDTTDANGQVPFRSVPYDTETKTVTVSWNGVRGSQEFVLSDTSLVQEITFTLKVKGLRPDKAFSDGSNLDVTKPFYPLGLQPQPGSAFYFTNDELFGKPGANFKIYLQKTSTPQDQADVTSTPTGTVPAAPAEGGAVLGAVAAQTTIKTPLRHTLSWEYWNGDEWIPLRRHSNDPGKPNQKAAEDFSATGSIELTVPEDMAPTTVNDQKGLWMRVRLISGGFGFTQKVTWRDGTTTNEFTYVIPQPPAVSDFRLGYTWQYGPFHPEWVFAYNDFQYEDRTEEARWPGLVFQPYKPVSDVTPALYLGFDKKLPLDRLGIYFDIEEARDETRGPALVWEYWNGASWQDLFVEDETRDLRLPGILSFIGPQESQALARFGTSLFWLRGRLKEDGPPGEPTVNGIFPNAVWAVQRETIVDEPMGLSTGQPDQVFLFRQIPLLDGERLEVREVAGRRANVEWRIIAMEVLGPDRRIIQELEELLGREGPQTDIEKGDLRLRRDRNKKVTEVWVRWHSQQHLFFSGPNDRHYLVERARGRLLFGNGEQGKIPPAGAAIQARLYRSGGGSAGNVKANTITQILSAAPGVEAVFNPRPAEGGADAETLEALSLRGPQTLRHRGRALLPADYETMAREASPAVGFARAIPTQDAGGRQMPGWVTLLIIPESEEPLPWPSFGLREQVRQYIEAHAPASVAAASHIYVIGPDYLPVDIHATIAVLDPAEAGAVEQRARAALKQFLHPLRGGPQGRGWEPGRDVLLSDVASVLERVEGVDYVEELALLLNGGLQGERVKVAADRIAVAGEIRLKIIQGVIVQGVPLAPSPRRRDA